MNAISDVHWDGTTLCWKAFGISQQQQLCGRISNALVLRSDGIAVIEGSGWDVNAHILNADGSLRVTLKSPFRPEQGFIFYYFIYEGEKLMVVLAGAGLDFKCEVDEVTGSLSSPRETR